jgi:hypothetical protein
MGANYQGERVHYPVIDDGDESPAPHRVSICTLRKVFRKFLWSIVNRKLCALLDDSRIKIGQFKNKIVESRSQIVTNLAEQNTDDGRGPRELEWGPIVSVIRRIRIKVDSNRLKIILPEDIDLPLQLNKMFLCPIDPLKSTVEWMSRNHFEAGCRLPAASF